MADRPGTTDRMAETLAEEPRPLIELRRDLVELEAALAGRNRAAIQGALEMTEKSWPWLQTTNLELSRRNGPMPLLVQIADLLNEGNALMSKARIFLFSLRA